jgi:hypothetical protein
MSIPVELSDLAGALADHGDGYLLTCGARGVKAITVTARVDGDVLRIPGASRGTSANLEGDPTATLLFPPREPRGHTLLIDGTARAVDDGFELTPASAVLHRPADHTDGAATGSTGSACGHDCEPV